MSFFWRLYWYFTFSNRHEDECKAGQGDVNFTKLEQAAAAIGHPGPLAVSLPARNARMFVVRFPDGDEKDYAYNVLAKQLFEQVDEEGNQYQIFKSIICHYDLSRPPTSVVTTRHFMASLNILRRPPERRDSTG